MTQEQPRDIKPLFDYGSIKPEHKEAAEEIANYVSCLLYTSDAADE